MYFSFVVIGLLPEEYGPLAQSAEALGFDSLWLPDHHIVPEHFVPRYPYREDGRPNFTSRTRWHDVWCVASYLGALTSRIKFGTGVYILPLRNPFVVAQAAATAQNFTGGRLIMGVGAGWMREEFEIVGHDFATRGARMDETLEILQRLWCGRPVEYRGRFYDTPPVRLGEAPGQRIPLVFGAHTEAALRRAAVWGDGWYGDRAFTLAATLDIRRTVDEMRAVAGRSKQPFTYYAYLEPPASPEKLHRLADAGFDHIVAPVHAGVAQNGTLQERSDELARFVDLVYKAGYRLDQSGPDSL